jgi:hypothetical protein
MKKKVSLYTFQVVFLDTIEKEILPGGIERSVYLVFLTLKWSKNWGILFLQSDKVCSSLLGVGEH